jgi:hypothetical protein
MVVASELAYEPFDGLEDKPVLVKRRQANNPLRREWAPTPVPLTG